MEYSQDRHDRDTQPIPRRRVQENLASESANAEGQDLPAEPAKLEGQAESIDTVYGEFATVQDQIPTPMPVRQIPGQARVDPGEARSSRGLKVVVALALLLSVLSLILNGFLLYGLLNVRQVAVGELDAAIAALDNLEGNGFHYEYHFQKTIPFSGDIPFNQELIFPFKGDIPIKTTVQVPIDAGILGQFVIDVPIDTTFHVDLEVPVKIDQTVHVDTEIPLDMTIPIDISPEDPAVQQLLAKVREVLLRLRDSF